MPNNSQDEKMIYLVNAMYHNDRFSISEIARQARKSRTQIKKMLCFSEDKWLEYLCLSRKE